MAAILPSSSLQILNPFSSSRFSLSQPKSHAPLFTARATPEDSAAEDDTNTAGADTEPTDSDPDSFENRLSQVRLRYRSGTGKKAEVRKSKKSGSGKKSSSPGAGVFLPPVALKEPVSGGLKVDFGFSPYSERVNGRVAMLGLSALLLVELATGKSVINYHSPSIVFIQVYFIAAVTAMYCKVEKEKVSIWPQ